MNYVCRKSDQDNSQTWSKSVGNRIQRLLAQYIVPGTLLVIQVWKADEYYFFRVKPMPGVSIIDVIGQMRIEENCNMYFANDDHVMVSLNQDRILTFDREGYVIEKKDFAMYRQHHKILLES